MKSIKNNDARNFETELLAITKHLGCFLKDIRKRKVANELIGNDDCSKDFDAEDFDTFADKLSAGVELTKRDNLRIKERAVKLTNTSGPFNLPLPILNLLLRLFWWSQNHKAAHSLMDCNNDRLGQFGTPVLGHSVENLAAYFGLCLLVWKVSCLQFWADDHLPSAHWGTLLL